MSRTTYVWRDGALVEREASGSTRAPAVHRDIEPYRSPLGTGTIDGRAAQREDLKRAGCRLVERSEYAPVYRNPKYLHLNKDR